RPLIDSRPLPGPCTMGTAPRRESPPPLRRRVSCAVAPRVHRAATAILHQHGGGTAGRPRRRPLLKRGFDFFAEPPAADRVAAVSRHPDLVQQAMIEHAVEERLVRRAAALLARAKSQILG